MERLANELLRTPVRLSSAYARLLVGLSLVVLALAALGFFLYDGALRLAYVSAIGSIGLGNLAWGVGSLLPEDQGGRIVRDLARLFFLVMLITLPIAFVLVIQN